MTRFDRAERRRIAEDPSMTPAQRKAMRGGNAADIAAVFTVTDGVAPHNFVIECPICAKPLHVGLDASGKTILDDEGEHSPAFFEKRKLDKVIRRGKGS